MSRSRSDLGPPTETGMAASQAKKSHREILAEEIQEGFEAQERPLVSLSLSGLSAGLDIGFSVLIMATALNLMADPGTLANRFFTATAYSVGFIFVVLGRSELFTEHTTLAVLPVLSGRTSLASLARLWLVLYITNQVGSIAFAWIASRAGPMLDIARPESFGLIAHRLIAASSTAMLLSAILAGWLMGLLSWLVAAARDTAGQLIIVWLITTSIGFMGLHHAILGSAEIAAAMFLDQGVTAADFGRALLWSTIGNAIGGTVFVAIIRYGHEAFGVRPARVRGGGAP